MKEDNQLITVFILLAALLIFSGMIGSKAQAANVEDMPVTITMPFGELVELADIAARSYSYISLSLGNNTNLGDCNLCWEDADGIGTVVELGHMWPLDDGFWLGINWVHASQIDKGAPFTDDHESYMDHFGVRLEYRWY